MYLPPGYNTKELESGVKNKWRWEWLNERGSLGEKWGDWLKKPNTPGSAYCEICFKTINYKSNGKKAFKSHAEDVTHLKNYRTWKSNQVNIFNISYLCFFPTRIEIRMIGGEGLDNGGTNYPNLPKSSQIYPKTTQIYIKIIILHHVCVMGTIVLLNASFFS
jgi:hypothetical protein